MAIVGFESICVQEDMFPDTETSTWIGKRAPISVSVSSNLIEQSIFLCSSNPKALVESFVDALDGLATQSKTQKKLNSLEIETSMMSELNRIFFAPIQRRFRKGPVFEFEHGCIEEEQEVSIQFLKTRKGQIIDLQDHLER